MTNVDLGLKGIRPQGKIPQLLLIREGDFKGLLLCDHKPIRCLLCLRQHWERLAGIWPQPPEFEVIQLVFILHPTPLRNCASVLLCAESLRWRWRWRERRGLR